MHKTLTVVAYLSIFAAASANAATVTTETSASTPYAFSIYLNGSPQNDNFNAIDLVATSAGVHVRLVDAGSVIQDLNVLFPLENAPLGSFSNLNSGLLAGVPRPAGQAFTYYNRMLDADPIDFPDSLGWTILGIVRTPTELSFAGGPLGKVISTAGQPNGRLFLANIYAPPVPEPSCLALTSVATLGLRTVLRRRIDCVNDSAL
jgi:hypothetical protein